ncbi:MAG: ion channel, partial [Geminicoccaceae bacterium]
VWIETLLTRPPGFVAKTFIMIAATAWLMASHMIGVWLWASLFVAVGAIGELEPAVYFSLVTFTTLGYGDITLTEQWRILGAICAVNGLLLFGFTTALLVELMSRLREAT